MSEDYIPRPQRTSSGWVVALAVAALLLMLLAGGVLVGLKFYHARRAAEQAAMKELLRARDQAEHAALRAAEAEEEARRPVEPQEIPTAEESP